MIIINLTGGLGNQMFQYAFGRYLSYKRKTELKYHFTNALFNTQRSFALDVFNIQAKEATSEDLKNFGIIQNKYVNRVLYLLDERYRIQFNKNIVTQHFPYIFDGNLRNTPDDRYIQGFFADERYFYGIDDILIKDFTLRKPLDKKNVNFIKQMDNSNSVSIHVRRGDYLTNKNNLLKFVGEEYYRSAISNIRDKVKDPTYFIFSDDIDWCKEQFKQLDMKYFIEHNTGANSYKDMVLMSRCKYNIVANSTFSWWGCWLNQNKKKFTTSLQNE